MLHLLLVNEEKLYTPYFSRCITTASILGSQNGNSYLLMIRKCERQVLKTEATFKSTTFRASSEIHGN